MYVHVWCEQVRGIQNNPLVQDQLNDTYVKIMELLGLTLPLHLGHIKYFNSWPLVAFFSLYVETFNVNTNTPVKAT